MIFNCPRCSAGHSVPVSMIPNDGMEMSCRRCNESFQVSVMEKASGSLPPLPGEPTRVGVVNPLDDGEPPTVAGLEEAAAAIGSQESTTDGGDAGTHEDTQDEAEPRGASPEAGSGPGRMYGGAQDVRREPVPKRDRERTRQGRLDDDPYSEGFEIDFSERLAAKTTRQKSPNLPGVDSEHDSTLRMNTPSEVPAVEPAVAVLNEAQRKLPATATGPIDLAPPPLASDVRAASPNIYERVEKGVPVQEARPPISQPRARQQRRWNEPSNPSTKDRLIAMSMVPVRKTAFLLNRAPLPLKVAMVVFPAALGIVLVITSGRNPWTADPVQVTVSEVQAARVEARPAAAQDEAPKPIVIPVEPSNAAQASAEPEAAPIPKAEARTVEPVPRPPMKRPGDEPAGEGRAYVQVDHARLRATAELEGVLSGKLELGQRVKVLDRSGDWILVLVEPGGPAGFISERLLGPRKPIALLARQIEFSNCLLSEEVSLDDCLYEGKLQHDACLQGCGAITGAESESQKTEAGPGMRCAEACRVAFADCQRSCKEDEKKGGKKRHLKARR